MSAVTPGQPQQTPVVQKPSPVVADQLLVETADSNKGEFDRMFEYGHLHPDQVKYPNHRLLKQGPNAYGVYQRIWGTTPVLQDTYNAEKNQSEESNSHPIFVRSYRVLRDAYLVDGPLTKGTAFTGLVAVKVTAAGINYSEDFAVTFTGGTGSGGTGLAIVNRTGGVDRVEIMAIGSYTVAPTGVDFSAGSGSGATGSTVIQPAAAVLVKEQHGKLPDDDPYSTLFDRVVRVYETLPGPLLTTSGYDEQTRVAFHVTRQKVAAGTATPALSTSGTTDLVIDARYEPIDSVCGWMTVEYLDSLPPSRVEKQSAGFQFPGIFATLASWSVEPICSITGPFAGVNYTLTRPRSASRPKETTISYSFTEPSLPALWVVTAPGSASRFFPIDANTIHDAIEVICSEGPTTLEDLPASTPSSYSAGDVLTIQAESRPNWKGKIYEKRVSTICETPA